MKQITTYIFIVFALVFGFAGKAKGQLTLPTPSPRYSTIIVDGDTCAMVYLPKIVVFETKVFKNKRERVQYDKLVRDVKLTLPYAKFVYNSLIETYEYIETLPTDEAKEKHLKQVEKDLFKEYKPILSKFSLSQGKLLIKLIDRECNQSAFNLLTAYLGRFRAGFWNFFAGMFGASLKTDYDAKNRDADIERVATLVENGLI
jgi:hypothetical protein